MNNNFDLDRFLKAQENSYQTALEEIRRGKKESHWMWYIFPQLKGLGSSDFAHYYGIDSLDEARAYLSHPVLSERLNEISSALLTLPLNDAYRIMGKPDDVKLQASMTLFHAAAPENKIFGKVLDKYFGGAHHQKTEQLLAAQ